VTLQVETVISDQILALTRPLTQAVPIVEPLLQAFAEAADKTLQERIGRAYDRLVELAMHNPRLLDAAINREATVIVDQTDVGPPVDRATPRARQLSDALARELVSLWAADALLTRKLSESQTTHRAPELIPLHEWPLYPEPWGFV
jgi:hypothetical protein